MIFKVRFLTAAATLAVAMQVASAMPEVPVASARALGVTKGRAFRAGLVFIDGKYISPPYVVSRWGTGLRINDKPVTGQVIDWVEFMKTQSGFKVSRSDSDDSSAAAVKTSGPESVPEKKDDESSSLDDLFDDDPEPEKKPTVASKPPANRPSAEKTPQSYSFDGKFVHNDASRALVKRINAARTEIDRTLRSGGFICFGDNYQRVSGDSRTAQRLLEKIPEMLRDASSAKNFAAMVRGAGIVYFSDELCRDLYRNRIDYRRLMDRREQWKKNKQLENFLKDVGTPLF